jgi:hypothetical protein
MVYYTIDQPATEIKIGPAGEMIIRQWDENEQGFIAIYFAAPFIEIFISWMKALMDNQAVG